MKQPRAFTLIEIMVAVSLLGIVLLTVGPTFRKSSISTKGAALTLAAALTEARQQAITQQVPVALVIPSDNGSLGQADSYYIASGEQPRITQVKWFGGEQPDLRLMVGHWPLDTGKLQDSTLTTTVTPPPEATFESDLDVSLWNLTQPKDFAFIFTPRGKLVTNGLPHFDGAYHILVSHGGRSTTASAPGTSGLPAATSPSLFTPSEVGSPYTVTIDPAGAVAVTPGVVGAVDGASYIVDQAQVGAVPAPATIDLPPTTNPTVTTVSALPDPAKLNLPPGVDVLLAPGCHATITTRASSPERAPLFCQWTTIGGGGTSSGESLRMTYLPTSGEWESTWHWKAPADAAPGDSFTIQGRIHDEEGNESPAYLSGVDPVIKIGDPSSRVVFQSNRGGDYEIYVMNADGTGQLRLTEKLGNDSYPSWSPDGSQIIYSSAGKMFAMNSDGTGRTQLSPDGSGSYSPDGTHIVFVTYRDLDMEIYRMKADGTEHTRLTTSPGYDLNPSWSPDGTQIAFSSSSRIYVMNADGTGRTSLDCPGENPSWSPDGTLIAFRSHRDGNYELYTTNTDGTVQERLTNNTRYDGTPVWSADSGEVFFPSSSSDGTQLRAVNADGTGERTVIASIAASPPSLTADGTRIIYRDTVGGDYEIFSINLDGTGQKRLTYAPGTDDSPTVR
jgi:prepilin-type N-terminal cleavage/methylation domain-containing protein